MLAIQYTDKELKKNLIYVIVGIIICILIIIGLVWRGPGSLDYYIPLQWIAYHYIAPIFIVILIILIIFLILYFVNPNYFINVLRAISAIRKFFSKEEK